MKKMTKFNRELAFCPKIRLNLSFPSDINAINSFIIPANSGMRLLAYKPRIGALKMRMSRFLVSLIIMFSITLIPSMAQASAKPELSSTEFYRMAGKLFKENKKAAAKQFQLFVKHYPKDVLVPEVQFMTGECFFNLDPVSQEALKKFQLVAKKYPYNQQAESAFQRIAEIYYNRKDYSRALDCLADASGKFPKGYLQYERLLLEAQCRVALDDFETAQKNMNEISAGQAAYAKDNSFNYINGLVNYHFGKDEAALENFRDVDSPEALLFLSESQVRLGKPILAIEKLKELIEKHAQSADSALIERANFLLGEDFFAGEDYKSAINSHEKFLRYYSRSVLAGPAIYRIGCAYLQQNDHLQARSGFQAYLQNEPKGEFTPLAIYLIGESFLKENRFKEASFAYGDMVNSFPENTYAPNAQFKLAWCYYNLNNFNQARISLIKFKQQYPESRLTPQAELLLGNTLAQLGEYSGAVAAFQRVIDKTTEADLRESALALMCRANYLDGNYPALVSASRYISNQFPPSSNPWRMVTYLYLAEGYLKQGMNAEATGLYGLCKLNWNSSPLLVYVYDGLAWAAFYGENYTEAVKNRELVLGITKQRPPAAGVPDEFTLVNRFELANAFFNQKKYLEALDIFEAFYKEHPEHALAARAAYNTGLCYYQKEYYGQAIEVWQYVEKNYPEAPETKQALWKIADTYFRAGSYENAVDNYRKIEKPAPANLELRIAQCYYNAKDSTSAVQSLKELVEKHPRAPEAKEAMELLCNLVDSPGSGESALSAIDDLRYILGKNNPLIVSARFKAAKKFFEGKNYARAIETLEELSSELANSGKFADANFFLAESYYQLGRLDESILTFKRFTENFPQDKRAVVSLFRMGSAQFKQNRFEDSVKTFEKLTAGHPECEYCPAALYNTALSYKKLENWDRVAATLKTYMEKYPSEAESSGASFELAAVYEEQKQYAQANKTLEAIRDKTLQCSGIWGETTFRIAENHMAAGNETLAMDEYSKLTVIEINPALETWALNAMARAGEYYERKNDDYKALSYYERICERTKGLAEKPSWLDAVKARIDVIKSKVVMQ